MAVIKSKTKKQHVVTLGQSIIETAYKHLFPRRLISNFKPKKTAVVSSSLQALTAAALTLPGLMPLSANAAEEEASFLYGYYEEGNRNLYGIKSRFNPIAVNSLLGHSTIKLADRIKFAFNYAQDTWSGATPVATAPLTFGGNGNNGQGHLVGGATPYLVNNNVSFDRQLNPLSSTGVKNNQLAHTISSASPETRNQGDFKLGYEWDEAALDVGGGISEENDYHSQFGNMAGRWDLNHKLTQLHLGQSYTNSNTTATLDHDATPYIWETSTGFNAFKRSNNHDYQLSKSGGNTFLTGDRQDWRTSMGLTQVVNESALIEAGFEFARGTGYMANPYKTVELAYIAPGQTGNVLTGQTVGLLEERPSERNQWIESLRYVQHIKGLDAAVHFDYSFSHDDWGVNAHTFQSDWVQPMGAGWAVTPKIRYYSQSAAYFYTPYLVTIQSPTFIYGANGQIVGKQFDANKLPTYYSSDPRLSGFGALSGGITLSKQLAAGIRFEASAEYYTHAGSLKLGGGGEGSYTNYNSYLVNGVLNVDLSSFSTAVRRHNSSSISSSDDVEENHATHAASTGHSHHGNHSGHAPAGVMFSHMLEKPNDFMVGVRYMRDTQSGNMLQGSSNVSDLTLVNNACGGKSKCYDTVQNMNMNMIMLDLMYAPTDWLTLMLMPQFVDMNMTSRALTGAPIPSFNEQLLIDHHTLHEHTTGGVGDTGMYAMFKLFEKSGHHIHSTLGISAPTGSVDITFRDTHGINVGYQHYGMQLGSGTWDFKPSITYTGNIDKYSWGVQLSGTKRLQNSNSSGYALGDIFQSTTWGSYGLLEWLSTSIRGVYTVQGTISGAFNGAYNPLGPIDYTSNYGGRYWDVGFGINAFVPKGTLQGNNLSFEWLQPVHTDVNGYQLPRSGALAATWSYGF